MTATKKTTAAKTSNSAEAAMAAGQETIEVVVKAGTEAASKGLEQAVAMGQEHVAAAVKAGTEAFKSFEDVASYGKDNVDAVMKSNAVLFQGVQDINKVLYGLVQGSLEDSVAATKKYLGCKTVKDVLEVQNELASAGYAKVLEDSRKITDMSVKLAEEAGRPITKRVNETVDRFTKATAA